MERSPAPAGWGGHGTGAWKANQETGTRPAHAAWSISFMHYDLGYFDLEQKTLQTIDNPFGTRLSPTS